MTQREPELELSWDQALAWRLGQQLLDSPGTDPVRVISKIGGVQAQVASSAAQAVAIRSKRLADIEHLLWEKRSLVKTWAMRGTLHLLPASEIGVWIAALRQRPWKITPAWEKYHGISKSQLDSLTGAIPKVMSGEPMTREELTAAVVAKTRDRGLGEALSSGWSQVLKPAANRGLLAQGPPRGRNVTFVDPGAWLGASLEEPARRGGDAGRGRAVSRCQRSGHDRRLRPMVRSRPEDRPGADEPSFWRISVPVEIEAISGVADQRWRQGGGEDQRRPTVLIFYPGSTHTPWPLSAIVSTSSPKAKSTRCPRPRAGSHR